VRGTLFTKYDTRWSTPQVVTLVFINTTKESDLSNMGLVFTSLFQFTLLTYKSFKINVFIYLFIFFHFQSQWFNFYILNEHKLFIFYNTNQINIQVQDTMVRNLTNMHGALSLFLIPVTVSITHLIGTLHVKCMIKVRILYLQYFTLKMKFSLSDTKRSHFCVQ
jgi:hypothetical protein